MAVALGCCDSNLKSGCTCCRRRKILPLPFVLHTLSLPFTLPLLMLMLMLLLLIPLLLALLRLLLLLL